MQYKITYRFYWRLNGSTRHLNGIMFVEAVTPAEALTWVIRPKLKHGDKHNLFYVFDSIRPVGRLRVE